jgi:pyruvate formate lyase activating enzyme
VKEALFYSVGTENRVHCTLCPHNCVIKPGRRGLCRVRRNESGKLISENYSQVSSVGFDPIEKKPLYHFHPGQIIFSVGSIGCNLHCQFCQNWEISQSSCEDFPYRHTISPEKIIEMAMDRSGNIGIAYTYNEPGIWYEYMLDIAGIARDRGLKNVMVSNGFINPEPLSQLIPLMDAFSIDLKAFTENFYRKLTHSHLQPVLESLKQIKASGRHLEITNLVITNQNDNPAEFSAMIDWIADELGKETVLHISRYYPTYRLNDPATSEKTLFDFYEIASRKLDHVFLGNLRSNRGQDTTCPQCKTVVILRSGYSTRIVGLNEQGHCRKCGNHVIPFL